VTANLWTECSKALAREKLKTSVNSTTSRKLSRTVSYTVKQRLISGSYTFHSKSDCPANDVKCHSCGRRGRYKRVCTASKAVHEIQEDDEDGVLLGSITADGEPWMVNIDINRQVPCLREQV